MVWKATDAQQFGDTIRRMRRERGISQELLAHKVGISKNHMQLLEAGRGSSRSDGPISNPRMTTVYGLAEALDVTASELLP
ncbi:helix-turn-helix transcriptional regulator [uncultured Microbacterium sp.]|uniref:helix-turn-helix domain-containing protein n=1 Tax=uncultured Microbacterium sp. TaxID=191216 RepID=UPI00344B52C2